MSAAAKCLQAMLAIFNIVVLAFGILICISGSYYLNSDQGSGAHNAGVALEAIGAFSIIVGLFGGLGACFRSKCLLIIYSVIILILVLAQCTLGGLAIANSNNQDQVNNYAQSVWNYSNDQMRNDFQNNNQCCGYSFATDQPGSNCLNQGIGTLQPCAPILKDTIKTLLKNSSSFLFVSAACEIIAFIISLILVFDDSKRNAGYGRHY